MNDINCYICNELKASVPFNSANSQNITVLMKLQIFLPEVKWNDSNWMCQKCFDLLDMVIAFRNSCLKANEKHWQKYTNQEHSDNDDKGKFQEEHFPDDFESVKLPEPQIDQDENNHSEDSNCGNPYNNNKEMNNHSKLYKARTKRCKKSSKTKNVKGSRTYTCEVCSKIFTLIKEIIQHCQDEHNMDPKLVKPYLCEKCNTRFNSSGSMKQHQRYHIGDRTHICSYCGKSYITMSDLMVHEYTHLNRRNYKCESCDKAFNTNKNLRCHILVVHTDSKLWKYHCDKCDRRFPLKSGYDQHIRRHDGDKRFTCLVCQKSFISNSEMLKHTKTHSNARPFQCPHCDKTYRNRGDYEVHLTKIHGIGNAKIPIRLKRFLCQICMSTFADKQKLTRHMCTHTGNKPFSCTMCDKKFIDKSYVKHHMKVHHNILGDQD